MRDLPETWCTIPDWRHYEVSTIGRVRSLDQTITDSLGRSRIQRGRMKATWIDNGGYRRVELSEDGYRYGAGAHRLVALAFIGEPAEGQEVRHLDGDSLNNCLTNLAWGTHSENIRDTIAAGRYRNRNTEKDRCPEDHQYSGVDSRGNRICQLCRTQRQREYMQRRRDGG